ncbi:hypothetical protein, partial [Phytoactinopolyspora endophytica]|uniref:hypothetical protein n=1 Tax=Phytoactinopolyspora endophytica TaxID=1642495 RepID=UPI0013ED3592
MAVQDINTTGPAPSTSGELLLTGVRIMRLRPPDDGDGPAEVVAHIQGRTDDNKPVSTFGHIEWQSPRDDNHFTPKAWGATESLPEKLVGERLLLDDGTTSVERLMRPLLAELDIEVKTEAAAERAAARLPRHAVRTRIRRAARYGLNIVRRRPGLIQPERRVSRLLGIEALSVALTGAVAAVRTGEVEGRAARGTWRSCDLGTFFDQHISRVNRFACAPKPEPSAIDGRTANTFADVEFIGLLPKDGTKGHLLEREALRYGLDSTRF